jgi:hypothetical protein
VGVVEEGSRGDRGIIFTYFPHSLIPSFSIQICFYKRNFYAIIKVRVTSSMVEHQTLNLLVLGSSPRSPTGFKFLSVLICRDSAETDKNAGLLM